MVKKMSRHIDASFVVYAAEHEFSEEDAAKVRWLISHIPSASTPDARLRIDVTVIDAEKSWREKAFYCPCGKRIKMELWNEKYCFGGGTILKGNLMPKYCPDCGRKICSEEE